MNRAEIKNPKQSDFPLEGAHYQPARRSSWVKYTLRQFLRDHFGLCAFVAAVSLLSVFITAAQNGSPSYTSDNSDWWSFTRIPEFDTKIPVQNREPSASNSQILGLKLDEDIFSKAAAKLGKVPMVNRGDGSTGRSQVCYVSPTESGRIHLIFEKGEVNEAFYLFEGGGDWKGSDLCVESNFITKSLSTDSGLRLGLSRTEISPILGKPSFATDDKLIYIFSIEKKTSAADFESLKPRYPELSDEELHKEYEFYTLGVYIEVRFLSDRLSYLAISKTEAY